MTNTPPHVKDVLLHSLKKSHEYPKTNHRIGDIALNERNGEPIILMGTDEPPSNEWIRGQIDRRVRVLAESPAGSNLPLKWNHIWWTALPVSGGSMLTPDFLVGEIAIDDPEDIFATFGKAWDNANSFGKDALSTLPLFDKWVSQ